MYIFAGYRPILEAMKTFAVDANPKEGRKCADIEVSCMYDVLYGPNHFLSVSQVKPILSTYVYVYYVSGYFKHRHHIPNSSKKFLNFMIMMPSGTFST